MTEKYTDIVKQAYENVKTAELSPFFQTLSENRLAAEYEYGKPWIISGFELYPELTFEKPGQWNDPLGIGWEATAIHNCSLISHDSKLFMFYRANPAMESLSARIGLAVYSEVEGWTDYKDNPLIYSTLENESLGCEDPIVYKVNDKFYLFYLAVYQTTQEDRTKYSTRDFIIGEVGVDINVAVSDDLYHWEKKGAVIPKEVSHLWAKSAVIPKSPCGEAVKIDGKYIMYISEGCGGSQAVGYSEDFEHWDFVSYRYLDTDEIGSLFQNACAITDFEKSNNIVIDFFYDDKSGIIRAAQALYNKKDPLVQLDINKGGMLSWGGMIQYKGSFICGQGWDAPAGKPVMYFYKQKIKG